jgi:hypothetical protein
MITFSQHQGADWLGTTANDALLILFTGGEQMVIEIG